MRFLLIDRITSLELGKNISAIKNLSLSEEYLADHFPLFPVMPGVFMLEAVTQTSAWLWRATTDFRHSMITLAEARNVKYADFFVPGQQLAITCEALELGDTLAKFKVQGSLGERLCVSGRITLRAYNLGDENPQKTSTDRQVINQMRQWYELLKPLPAVL